MGARGERYDMPLVVGQPRGDSGITPAMETTALLCRKCSWFGVYRTDVTERISACPVCGSTVLAARDTDESEWHELGRQLLGPDDGESA